MWHFLVLIYVAFIVQGSATESNTSAPLTFSPLSESFSDELVTLIPNGGITETFCNGTHPAYCYTKLSLDDKNRTIARGLPQSYAAFKCPILVDVPNLNGIVRWYLYNTSKIIGMFDFGSGRSRVYYDRNNTYKILQDGGLLIQNGRREVVDRYICTYENRRSQYKPVSNSSAILYRLDFSSWYSPVIFDSVFYGSVVVSFLLCGITFIINLIWIAIQKGGLYWIKRREQESRLRSMVQAMEVYRQRQLHSLHDAYNRNVNMIRDHYHMQVEQIRDAYTTQISRLKDYRQARIENVTAHLDTLRDNYNQQLAHMREYGSRHGEQLLESYERQVNRLRTFSLQQRLRLMRQFNVKQSRVNKLLSDPNRISEEGEADELFPLPKQIFPDDPAPLRRSLSSLSLPEFRFIEGDDIQDELEEIKPARRLTNQMELRPGRPRQKKSVSESEAADAPPKFGQSKKGSPEHSAPSADASAPSSSPSILRPEMEPLLQQNAND